MIRTILAGLTAITTLTLAFGIVSAQDPDQPLPPEEAARTMIVPDGFQVTLFAGEPDVQQPIGFCIDDRGRLWVAEAYNYPNHTRDPGDRIIILEDTDGDGSFDERTVFYDQLNYVTGIEVGFGGAWVMSPPYFYFIPDRNGDDFPDGPPEVLLEGFGTHANAHNLANGLAWGPDGWLYGTHGRTNWSMIRKPTDKDSDGTRFDGGVYRYHPVRHEWEPFCDGTTNPWGIDWDDFGQAFICNCVNPHLFHAIQGAHYEPWRNRKSSEFAYQRIPTIADHLHFVGGGNVRDGIGTHEEDAAGGGHAHCGTMVYLGDNWPPEYRNTIFMNNIHGRRINNDILRRQGSGYTASHGPDLLRSRDPWFMGVTLAYGFDGAVYVSDWSDTGECHSVRNTRKGTGRIYRISYGEPNPNPTDLAGATLSELVALQLHPNDRYVRHARRLLQERFAAGQEMEAVHAELHELYRLADKVPQKLRALWALQVTGGLQDDFLIRQSQHESEYIRAWAVRLMSESLQPPERVLKRFEEMALEEESAIVRLHLASALQRQKLMSQRWTIAEALAGRSEDSADPNLPLMIWYGIEPMIHDDIERCVNLIVTAEIPLIRRHMARRIVSSSQESYAIGRLVANLPRVSNEVRADAMEGLLTGMAGRRQVDMPRQWPGAYAEILEDADDEVRRLATRLALVFEDAQAIESLKQIVIDAEEQTELRIEAMTSLVDARVSGLDEVLIECLSDESIRAEAARGLAAYRNSATAESLLARYHEFEQGTKQIALQTLASRAAWAERLIEAVESGQVQPGDLTAYTARQIASLGDEELTQRLQQVWGDVRPAAGQLRDQIKQLKRTLNPIDLARADVSSGRALFKTHCANCHKLFGEGGNVGPDITGSQRTNLDYMLENLVDPSAAVARDYQMTIFETVDGRVINGIIVNETDQVVTIQTVDEEISIPTEEIESRTQTADSIMPNGLLEPLTDKQIRDLFKYLASSQED